MAGTKEKSCANCASVFWAARTSHKSEDGYRRYCSLPCRSADMRKGSEHRCLNCGATFYLSPSTLLKRGGAGCCSAECQRAFYVGQRSAEFEGGYVAADRGEHMTLLPRPGYVGKYIGDHRIVASQAIGRLVRRDEFVIRINRNPDDNRPENLFICATNSEFCKRRNGSLPWPSESNLPKYAAAA